MKSSIDIDQSVADDEICIHVKKITETVSRLVEKISGEGDSGNDAIFSSMITGKQDETVTFLKPENIVRIYSLQKKVYAKVYGSENNQDDYELSQRLYQIEELMKEEDFKRFIRISNTALCINNGTYYPYYPILERKYGGQLGAICVQTLVNVGYGLVFSLSTFIFSKDRWSLTRQTLTHFFIITTSCLLGGWICYWYPHSVLGFLIALAEYVVTYVIIWFCVYQNYKKQIRKINETVQ